MNVPNFELLFFEGMNFKKYTNKYFINWQLNPGKKNLWNYVSDKAWKVDEIIFDNEKHNDMFYCHKMNDMYKKIYSININFNVVLYVCFNLDLINKCNTIYQYLNHYLHYGYKEKRICDIISYKSFDLDYFIKNNSNLNDSCKCVYDYINYFVANSNNINLNCCSKYYNDEYDVEKNTKTAIKMISLMKDIFKIKMKDSFKMSSDKYDEFIKSQFRFNIYLKDKDEELQKITNQIIYIEKEKNIDMNKYNLYPFIFHKIILNLVVPETDLKYEVYFTPTSFDNNESLYVAHLHCFDISKFQLFYGDKFNCINENFKVIIVTYSKGDIPTFLMKYIKSVIIIKIDNKGMDIGAKIIAMDYLNKLKLKVNYVLFLHSKTDPEKRKTFFKPFFNNLDLILTNLNNNYYDGFFPPLILNGDYYHLLYNDNFNIQVENTTERGPKNLKLFHEFCDYLNLDKNILMFPEGNVYILKYKIANELFKSEYYDLMNTSTSFDANWVMLYYNLYNKNPNVNIHEIYKYYLRYDLHGNNLSTKLGYNGLADSQIEHIFERLLFNLIKKHNGKIYILPYSNNVKEQTKKLQDVINFSYLYGEIKISNTELILTNMNTNKRKSTLAIIACHSNSKLRFKSLINNVNYLVDYCDKIIICNSKEFRILNLEGILQQLYPIIFYKFEFVYTNNDKFLCYSKWHHVLKVKYDSLFIYKRFIILNDSFLIHKPMDDFFNFVNSDYEMQTLLISNENRRHFTDFIRSYNYPGILKLIKLYEKYISDTLNKKVLSHELINELEINSQNIFFTKNGLFEENQQVNINFIDDFRKIYILIKGYPILKLKAIEVPHIDYPKPYILPNDFQPVNYREIHSDLTNLDDNELYKHFILHGIVEGRAYKSNQITVFPDYIENILEKCNVR